MRVASTALSLAISLSAFIPVAAQGDSFLNAAQDISLSATQVQSVMAGRDLSLSGTTVDGKAVAGGSLECRECSISGSVVAGRDVTLDHCTRVQNVSSGGDAVLSHARVLSNITAGGDLDINDSLVDRNAVAGREIKLNNAIIKGELSQGGHYMKLDHSQTGTIRFSGQEHGMLASNSGVVTNSVIGNGSVVSNGSNVVSNGSSRVSNGSSMISVGSHSMSSVNGYMVSSTTNQTTVVTPGQSVYVNGRKVSGDGPENYADYRSGAPGAPTVRGPGWSEALADKHAASKKAEKNKTVINILELSNNSTVQGDVVFESGYGQVKIQPGSVFQGKVVNGTVERLPQ
ncbi:MAG TPA: hypothetical protein V6C52_06385 [Coleofasciculaceae cyanobacterium]|jgi:hypothetical protein